MQGSGLLSKSTLPGSSAPAQEKDERSTAPVCLRALRDESLRLHMDQEVLFRDLAFTGADLDVPGLTVPHRQATQMTRRALKQMVDPEFGFHLGQRSKITHSGVLALGMLASRTLGEAMALKVQFPVSAGHLLSVHDERSPRRHHLVAEPMPGDHDIEAFLVDELFTRTVSLRRKITGADYAPAAVEMVRRQPANPGAFERFFGCTVTFDGLRNRLVSDIAWLDFELPLASAVAYRQSVEMLTRENGGASSKPSTPLSVERQILKLLPAVVSPAQLASQLHMSERSLRRKLADQSISYRQLLDDCRKSRALELLGVGRRSMAEVAVQTGFADTGSFRRAFRRWTGAALATSTDELAVPGG